MKFNHTISEKMCVTTFPITKLFLSSTVLSYQGYKAKGVTTDLIRSFMTDLSETERSERTAQWRMYTAVTRSFKRLTFFLT